MTIALREVVERLGAEGLLRAAPELDEALASREVTGVTSDSRAVRPGTLFCAVRGTSGDGHDYLSSAAADGAVAALVERPDPAASLPQVEVGSGRRAAAYAAAAFYRDPWRDLTLVGVTGTNGKTTTTAILRHLLSRRTRAASIGTLGALDANGQVIPGTEGLTTPGPIELARWLRDLRDADTGAVAMEVSSHALHQARVGAARFDAAIFTNLSRDHLDYHGTLEEYREAKLELLQLLKPGGAALLNADDPAWRDVSAPESVRRIRFGTDPNAEVRAEGVEFAGGGMTWTLRTPGGSRPVRMPLLGHYNVANALGAAAALWALGWSLDDLVSGLEGIPQVPGRLERVPTPDGAASVLIDFAHTPDGLERALAAVRPLTSGRLIVVFGAGGDRDRGKRPEMGRVAAAGADLSIVTSDNPRTEDPEVIIDEIEVGMGNALRLRVPDRRAAIRRAIQEARPGDIVLLAGKGHETYQILGTERRSFDERVVVREIFAERGVQP